MKIFSHLLANGKLRVENMKIFTICVFFLEIFSLTSCESTSNEKSYYDIAEMLDTFDPAFLQKIEERLGMPKDEIVGILKRGESDKDARSVKTVIDLLLENDELMWERSRIHDLVSNVFIPGKIPHQFFCAMAIYEDILQHAYQKKGVNLYKPRVAEEPEAERYRSDPMLVSETLIEELMKRAPEIDPDTIKSVVYDNLPPFRGPASKTYHYHDSVLMNFISWHALVSEERLPLAKAVATEMKQIYGEEEWKNHVSEFSLVHARGWPLSGYVQHKLLRDYINYVNKDPAATTDFDTILQKLMPSGWYFPTNHIQHINLLLRAVRQCDDYAVRELDYEIFLPNREYVIPQATACSSGKTRNLDWYLTSTRQAAGSTPADIEDHQQDHL